MKHYILGLLMFAVGMMTVACSDEVSEQLAGEKSTVRARLAGYLVDGDDATLSGENQVTDVKACLFEDGVLTRIYDIPSRNDGNYDFIVDSKDGNLFVVVNTGNLLDWSEMVIGYTTESEWMERTVSISGNEAPMFFTGKVGLEKQSANVPVTMTLKRGVARLDITMEREDVQVKSVTVKNVAETGFLNARESVMSPESARHDVVKGWDEPLSGDTNGVMYLLEQYNGDLSVDLNVLVGGTERKLTAKLPQTIRRNAVYTLNLGGDGSNVTLSVNVDEWDYADDTVLSPDFKDKITVDMKRSVLPEGVTVENNNSQLVTTVH